MPRAALLLAIGLSATMAMAAEVGKEKGDGKEEGGKGVVSVVGTALKPTKEEEKEDKDKGCWWEQQEDKEDMVKDCTRNDILSGRYTPDMCGGFKKKGYCTAGKYAGWMQKSCFTTCNGCCADINKHCPRWANEGYCKKGGSRQEWMTKNCRKSCGVCCGDDDLECKIQHMGRKMKAMGMKFKEVMTQAEKDKYRMMEKMEDMVKGVQETVKDKLGWLVNSLQECGCNVTRPEKPDRGWACEACSGPADYWKCGGCSMIGPGTPEEPWFCDTCKELGAGYVCKECKSRRPEGFTKPGRPEITRPQAKPTKKPGKPTNVKPNKPLEVKPSA